MKLRKQRIDTGTDTTISTISTHTRKRNDEHATLMQIRIIQLTKEGQKHSRAKKTFGILVDLDEQINEISHAGGRECMKHIHDGFLFASQLE